MNVCKNCGKEYDGNFCPVCGLRNGPMTKCPACGAFVSTRFCPDCGTKIEASEKSEYVNVADVTMSGAIAGEERVCPRCGSVVNGRYCAVCGVEYGAERTCRTCGNKYIGSFCPVCGTRDNSRERGHRQYHGISRSICALVLAFAVLFVVECTSMNWQNRSDYGGHSYGLWKMWTSISTEGLGKAMFVFSIVAATFSVPASVYGIVLGGKKTGGMSVYQVVGIIGSCLMFVGLGLTIFLNEETAYLRYSVEPGAICALVTSSAFLVATVVFLSLSVTGPGKATAYREALEYERNRINKKNRFN